MTTITQENKRIARIKARYYKAINILSKYYTDDSKRLSIRWKCFRKVLMLTDYLIEFNNYFYHKEKGEAQ